jgi:hypothetical protein
MPKLYSRPEGDIFRGIGRIFTSPPLLSLLQFPVSERLGDIGEGSRVTDGEGYC